MFARRIATQNRQSSFFFFTLTPCITLMQLHIFTPTSFLVLHRLGRKWQLRGGEGVSASRQPWLFFRGLSTSHSISDSYYSRLYVFHFLHLHFYSAAQNWNLWPSIHNLNFWNLYIILGRRMSTHMYIAKPPDIGSVWLQFTIPIKFVTV